MKAVSYTHLDVYKRQPQHWMLDWPIPFPLYVESAKGVKIKDIDGNELIDLCLGDTGAMFGLSLIHI